MAGRRRGGALDSPDHYSTTLHTLPHGLAQYEGCAVSGQPIEYRVQGRVQGVGFRVQGVREETSRESWHS